MNKIEELRKLTTEELNNKIKENKEELFNLRFQQATGNLEKPGRLKDLRKEVAREALRLASHKLPIKTKFVKKEDMGG